MHIDVWTDTACPFCYIGMRQLEAALREFDHADSTEVQWHSFQLMPDAPAHTDQSINEMLAERKGITATEADRMNDRVTAMAASHGAASQMIERLSAAYLTEGVYIGDVLRQAWNERDYERLATGDSSR